MLRNDNKSVAKSRLALVGVKVFIKDIKFAMHFHLVDKEGVETPYTIAETRDNKEYILNFGNLVGKGCKLISKEELQKDFEEKALKLR